jgi:hypothetical protein
MALLHLMRASTALSFVQAAPRPALLENTVGL